MEEMITIVLRTVDTNEMFFRDCLESIVAQTSEYWELYVLDENPTEDFRRIVAEFFPSDDRVHYRHMRRSRSASTTYNHGIHSAAGSYVLFMGQHDRLSRNTVSEFLKAYTAQPEIEVLYSDHDELEGMQRVHPHFKSVFNPELLYRTHYIGDFICVSLKAFKRLGLLREELDSACIYEFLLRCVEKKAKVYHLPRLLYHQRVMLTEGDMKAHRKERTRVLREFMTCAEASYLRRGYQVKVTAQSNADYWRLEGDGSDYRRHKSEYMLLRDEGVRVLSRRSVERMYALLKQPDVAVVGVRFLGGGFTLDNCGYIFDREGLSYPACHGDPFFEQGYDKRHILPRDVSMVDTAYCMLDAKIYKKSGGFDKSLAGRDIMLDYCLRMRSKGFRVIYEPAVVCYKPAGEIISTMESNDALMQRWGDVIREGDPFYNENMAAGLSNYTL